MSALLKVLLRRFRLRILAWVLPLVALVAISPKMYGSTYATVEERAVVVEQLRASAGTRLVYGELPLPGGAGQMMVWEVGSYVAVLGCISTMLLALALTRGEEEQGGTELVRAHGVSQRVVLGAAALVVSGQVLLLAVGSVAVVAVQVGHVAEISTRGALVFGVALALVTGLFGALGLLCGQVFPSSGQGRSVLFTVLALAFVVRGLGEARGWGWTRWASPLGWLQLLSPFTRDRLSAGALLAPVPVVVLALAVLAASRREFAAGLVRSDERSSARARVRGVLGLAELLGRRQLAGWLLAVVGTSAFFASMSGTMTSAARKDAHTGDLMSQMTGGLTPTAGYFSYMGMLVALLAGCFAVARVLAVRRQESAGLLDPVLATGRRRQAPLLAALAWAVVGAVLMLLAASALAVASAHWLVDEPGAWRFGVRALLGQLPAVLLCAAVAAFLVGLVPRWSVLAWLPVAASGAVTMLGPTMKAPRWLLDCSLFSHAPVTGNDVSGWLVLLSLAAVCAALAGVTMRRRDVLIA